MEYILLTAIDYIPSPLWGDPDLLTTYLALFKVILTAIDYIPSPLWGDPDLLTTYLTLSEEIQTYWLYT